jgi:hypothetical protein
LDDVRDRPMPLLAPPRLDLRQSVSRHQHVPLALVVSTRSRHRSNVDGKISADLAGDPQHEWPVTGRSDAGEFRSGSTDDGVEEMGDGRRFDPGQSVLWFRLGDVIEQALIADRLTRSEVLIAGHVTSIRGKQYCGKPRRRTEMLSMRSSPDPILDRCGRSSQTETHRKQSRIIRLMNTGDSLAGS